MKRVLAGCAIACAVAAIGFCQTPDKPAKPETPAKAEAPTVLKVGDTVDGALKLRDLDGKETEFSAYKGKVVVIAFWSIECPYLKVAEPKLIKLHADLAGKDAVLLGVNSNAPEIGAEPQVAKTKDEKTYADIRAHVASKKIEFPVFVDHGAAIADLLAAKTTPHCFVVDQKGVLRYSGALDDDPRGKKDAPKAYVKEAVDLLLAGKAVEKSTVDPYG